MSTTTVDIVAALRKGNNRTAIQELYQSYPSISKFIRRNGGDEFDARDVFQDALLVLYRNAQKNDFKLTCAPGTYLYSVSRFLWKDVLKKRNKQVELTKSLQPCVAIEDEIEKHQEQQIQAKKLATVLNQLGDKCKLLLQAYYYQKMSMKDIAAQFDYSSVNSAKTQKYKCIERAKKIAANPITSPSKF
jgi:RNA polymerase sigma factor (sigma-70 family)